MALTAAPTIESSHSMQMGRSAGGSEGLGVVMVGSVGGGAVVVAEEMVCGAWVEGEAVEEVADDGLEVALVLDGALRGYSHVRLYSFDIVDKSVSNTGSISKSIKHLDSPALFPHSMRCTQDPSR